MPPLAGGIGYETGTHMSIPTDPIEVILAPYLTLIDAFLARSRQFHGRRQ